MPEIIRKGDPTDHGGKVLEGSLTDLCHDLPIAMVGHMVQCPKCKGSFAIVEGAPVTSIYGKGVALAGMKTACGASLIATQFTDLVEYGGSASASSRAPSSKRADSSITAATLAPLKPVEIGILLGVSRFANMTNPPPKKELGSILTLLRERNDCPDIVAALEDEFEESSDDDDNDDFSSEDDDTADLAFQNFSLLPPRQSADDFPWKQFPDEHRGLVKIGVHETNESNVASLVGQGPSERKLGSGNGLGKGRGFYITPVGRRELRTATSAVSYGDRFLAVYMPRSFVAERALDESENHVNTLDEVHGHKFCYYLMSGGGEIVIPERCFPYVKIVSSLEELDAIEMSRPDAEAQAIYDHELDAATRMNELTDKYREAQSSSAKARIAAQWRTMERNLEAQWLQNGAKNTLWLNVTSVDQYVTLPQPINRW